MSEKVIYCRCRLQTAGPTPGGRHIVPEKSPTLCPLLQLCQEDDPNLLCYLVPYIYNQFPEHVVNNGHILNVVVGTIDAKQLQTLISLVIQGNKYK